MHVNACVCVCAASRGGIGKEVVVAAFSGFRFLFLLAVPNKNGFLSLTKEGYNSFVSAYVTGQMNSYMYA